MHTLDAEFLFLEDSCSPLHIAGISIFEGPAPTRSEMRQLCAVKLADYPAYRQRVRSLPLSLGRPRWADGPTTHTSISTITCAGRRCLRRTSG